MLRAQALIRGYLTRKKHEVAIAKIKKDAYRKSDKYVKMSKLQANIKGFLFR